MQGGGASAENDNMDVLHNPPLVSLAKFQAKVGFSHNRTPLPPFLGEEFA